MFNLKNIICFVVLRTTNKKGDIKVKTKQYTEEQEQIARFAKAMGHPARMAILSFLAKQESCFFGDIHEELPIAKATVSQHLKRAERCRINSGRNRNTKSSVLYQPRELGTCP